MSPASGRFRDYYLLTKPGIVKSNTIVSLAAFLFGSKGNIDIISLAGLAVGVALVIAGSCVLNNYIDRDIDKYMARTKKRATAAGIISGQSATWYGSILILLGSLTLLIYTNRLTTLLGLLGVLLYVVVYGYFKRRNRYGTLVGSLSGAIPPLAGYTAATGQVDIATWLLFFTLVIWQMPHFYAIAIFRQKDYAAAKVPVWSVVSGIASTQLQMRLFIVLFAIVSPLLSILATASKTYAIAMIALSVWWLYAALRVRIEPEKWARKLFGLSIVILMCFSLLLSLDSLLP